MESNERYKLCKQADELLAASGCDIWGKDVPSTPRAKREEYNKKQFESRMQTGAYKRSSERAKRN